MPWFLTIALLIPVGGASTVPACDWNLGGAVDPAMPLSQIHGFSKDVLFELVRTLNVHYLRELLNLSLPDLARAPRLSAPDRSEVVAVVESLGFELRPGIFRDGPLAAGALDAPLIEVGFDPVTLGALERHEAWLSSLREIVMQSESTLRPVLGRCAVDVIKSVARAYGYHLATPPDLLPPPASIDQTHLDLDVRALGLTADETARLGHLDVQSLRDLVQFTPRELRGPEAFAHAARVAEVAQALRQHHFILPTRLRGRDGSNRRAYARFIELAPRNLDGSIVWQIYARAPLEELPLARAVVRELKQNRILNLDILRRSREFTMHPSRRSNVDSIVDLLTLDPQRLSQ